MWIFPAILGICLSIGAQARDLDASTAERLRQPSHPVITGETLLIEGPINSAIYDYLAYAGPALKQVKVVELNSLGGDATWGIAIAEKIRALNITTRLTADHYCASACTFIFGSGTQREASADAWFGVHGVRPGAGFAMKFDEICQDENSEACKTLIREWSNYSQKLTDQSFDFLEGNGTSPLLRAKYFSLPDDPNWREQYNVLRKPDWVLSATEARELQFVTKILP
jgi:ATP-dependent protease ClpP protease subunit